MDRLVFSGLQPNQTTWYEDSKGRRTVVNRGDEIDASLINNARHYITLGVAVLVTSSKKKSAESRRKEEDNGN